MFANERRHQKNQDEVLKEIPRAIEKRDKLLQHFNNTRDKQKIVNEELLHRAEEEKKQNQKIKEMYHLCLHEETNEH